MATITVTTFGYGHAPAPDATAVFDLREILSDPHADPALRHKTARDPEVRAAVFATPGADQVRARLVALASTLLHLSERTGAAVSIAIGCAGGRHRAPAMAIAVADDLAALGHDVTLVHRDLHRDVIGR